ncbi:MAG: iron ABC transporter permease [Armatimonadota bacterium]|nr:iron ABC transporter permease [Armatimonadota bacterium]MDR7548014.1 iron ABC transporter permease [Armatimonadota bacterium]MDR7553677.1 iron ABC transporter permease [Armatimonadota bacterium]MDR7559509.1 iron ABC transporter permease [Armatimonadota bacterium]
MARVLTVPAVRAGPNLTLLAWSTLTLLGGLLLPWTRPGRDLFVFLPEATGAALARDTPLVAAILAAALLGAGVALLPWPNAQRGRAAVALGAAGVALVVLRLFGVGQPFGWGAVVAALGFLAVLGTGLALSGVLRADPFIAGSILWVAAFVLIFILFPLWAVLEASVVVRGRFTLSVVAETLRSPGFFLLNNPATPRNETALALAAGGLAVVLMLFVQVGRRRRPTVWTPAVGAGAFVLAALYLGFGALRNSVLLAIVVGVISTALGFLFALLGERSRLPTRRLLGPFSILPIITPPFVLGLAMIYMFGRRGFVTYQVLGISTNIFFGPLGVAVAQILAYAPIAYLVLQGVVQALDPALEEAAETLGASRWHILRTVIWPLARPGIANAFLLVAIESLADFGNPIIIGGGKPFLATEVFFAIIGRFNPNEAAVYGVVLLLMTLSIFLLQRYWVGRRSYVTVTGKPSGARPRPLPAPLDYGVSLVFVAWMVLIVALYGSVFVGSLTKLWGFDYTFTLEHLRNLSPTGWKVFWTSTKLSAYAAIPSTLLGFLIGYLVTRIEFPGRAALEFNSMLSFAVPGTVMGIGYILAFNQGALLLTGTSTIIILAFVFRNMPVAIRSGVAAIHQIDRSLEEASTMLRANAPTTLRRIVMPLVRPALLSGLVFAFVRAMTAVSQVIFLITPQHSLATTQILTYIEYGSQGRGASLASLLTVFMILVILALYLVNRRLDVRAARELAQT